MGSAVGINPVACHQVDGIPTVNRAIQGIRRSAKSGDFRLIFDLVHVFGLVRAASVGKEIEESVRNREDLFLFDSFMKMINLLEELTHVPTGEGTYIISIVINLSEQFNQRDIFLLCEPF